MNAFRDLPSSSRRMVVGLSVAMVVVGILTVLGRPIAAELIGIAVFTMLAYRMGQGTIIANPRLDNLHRTLVKFAAICLTAILVMFVFIYVQLQ